MHKAKAVIGLPVLDHTTGQELGVVRDVLFDEEWTFCGLFVEVKALFRRGRFIPSNSIHAIGDDCVIVPHLGTLGLIQNELHLSGVITGPKVIVGKPLYTTEGRCLGLVEDVYFEQEIGEIIGYEVSDGLLSDLFHGRKSITPVENSTVGEDAVVIDYSNKEEEI